MSTATQPIIVYAESNPNPSTMKFVVNKLLIESGATMEFTDPEEVTNSPFAARLFNFPFVQGLFFAQNFVTITKTEVVEWNDILQPLREFIQAYVESGKPIFDVEPMLQNQTAMEKAVASAPTITEPKTDKEKEIVGLLEEYVRPAVEGDGGAIHFKSFDEQTGVVTVVLKGACSGCPSSMVTLKSGIESLFHRMIPEVKSVEAEEL